MWVGRQTYCPPPHDELIHPRDGAAGRAVSALAQEPLDPPRHQDGAASDEARQSDGKRQQVHPLLETTEADIAIPSPMIPVHPTPLIEHHRDRTQQHPQDAVGPQGLSSIVSPQCVDDVDHHTDGDVGGGNEHNPHDWLHANSFPSRKSLTTGWPQDISIYITTLHICQLAALANIFPVRPMPFSPKAT